MKQKILNELKKYKTYDEDEQISLNKIIEFLENNENCFSRTNLKGHLTAGGLVYNSEGKVLLNHHKKMAMWMQFGGHCDGNPNPLETAFREVFEESGLSDITLMSNEIFDLGTNYVPERGNEPEHIHYDINYLFYDNNVKFSISDESLELKWCTINEAKKLINKEDKSMQRMIKKMEEILK